MNFNLTPPQQDCLKFLEKKKNVFLCGLVGAGKTRTVLAYLSQHLHERILILAPKNVITHTWEQELTNYFISFLPWKALKHGRCATAREITLVNFDRLHYIDQDTVFDIIIVDESTFVKNTRSKTGQLLLELTKTASSIVCMSGTPVSNTTSDLYGQLFYLNVPLISKTQTSYEYKYLTKKFKGTYTQLSDKKNSLTKLVESARSHIYYLPQLSEIMISYHKIDVPMSSFDLSNRYKQLSKTSKIQDDTFEIKFKHETPELTKIDQFLRGGVYTPTYQHIHNDRVNAVSNLIAKIKTNVILVYWYEFEKNLYENALHITSGLCVDAWNAGEKTIMLVQAQSISHGLNLQFGGHTIIWTAPTFYFEIFYQTCARLARHGQKYEVNVYIFFTANTLHEAMLNVLTRKYDVHEEFLTAIQN